MSRIDELIREMCPDGVPRMPLGDIATVTTGSKPPADSVNDDGEFLYWNGGTKPSGQTIDANTPGNVITIPSRGSVGIVGFSFEPFWCGPLCYRVVSNPAIVLSRFLYFCLKANEERLIDLQQSGSIPALNKKQLLPFELRVPPLPVQKEIVRILDTFTELEAELEAELEPRQVQFEFMRDQFLESSPFEQGAKIQGWQKFALKELANRISDGSHNPPKGSIGGEYPMISAKNVSRGEIDFNDARMLDFDDFEKEDRRTQVKPGCVLLTIVGAIGRVAVVDTTQPMVFQRSICVIEPKSELLRPEFLKYALESSRMQQNILSGAAGAAQKGLYLNQVANLSIALPDLKTQDEIISNLKPLDELVRNISVGLPAEINARRKQYEYYRDKLLTFEELVA